MSDDFEIDVRSETIRQSSKLQLPLNFITVGEIDYDDVKVYIKQDTYKEIEKLALSDTTKELGSIILGDYTEDLGKTHVIISKYIEAKYTDASASTLTFTHETWDYIYTEHDKMFPSLKIIGWQHTHPNYGIFLSNYDIFIQENFFNVPFQVAYVVDPIQHIRGFFQWKNGKVEKLKGFYIYDDIGKVIKIEQTKPIRKDVNLHKGTSYKWTIALLCLLVVTSVTFTAALISFDGKLRAQEDAQNELLIQIDKQESDISTQEESIKELKQELTDNISKAANTDDVQGLVDKLELQQLALDNQEELIGELKTVIASLEKGGDNSLLVFKNYTIKSGDSITSICEENGIDFSSNAEIIKAINGISDLDIIQVGQSILLPVIQ